MAKKTKKYADGGDVYEGTDLARSMGVRGVPEPGLEEVYPEQYMGGVGSIKGVGGSALKAVAPKVTAKEAMKRADDFFIQEEAKAQARFAANKAARQSEIDDYAKNKAIESAKDQQRMALKKANDADKVYLSDEAKAAMGNKVNKFRLQEPPPAVRSLDDRRVLKKLEYKKGGTVKVSSASKRADGCAIRGKTRA